MNKKRVRAERLAANGFSDTNKKAMKKKTNVTIKKVESLKKKPGHS